MRNTNIPVEFDSNPQASEAPYREEVIMQKIETVDGVQRVVEKKESITSTFKNWLQSHGWKEKRQEITLSQPITREQLIGQPNSVMLVTKEGKSFRCIASGFGVECNNIKCIAHVVTQQIRDLKADTMNRLTICKAHEAWFNTQPLKVWYRFVKQHYPQNFNYVLQRIRFVQDQITPYLEVDHED